MNPNLLKITSIPISIEVNVTNGTLKAPEDKEPLKIDINRTPGGYKMESRPAKINMILMRHVQAWATANTMPLTSIRGKPTEVSR